MPILARKFLAKNQPRKSKQSRKGKDRESITQKGVHARPLTARGARTLIFSAFESFSSCDFWASIARTPFYAILWRSLHHIVRYFFREFSTPPNWRNPPPPPPPPILNFTQAHVCDTPFCNISQDNCAISPLKQARNGFCDTVTTSIARNDRCRCWASEAGVVQTRIGCGERGCSQTQDMPVKLTL